MTRTIKALWEQQVRYRTKTGVSGFPSHGSELRLHLAGLIGIQVLMAGLVGGEVRPAGAA